MTIVESQVSKCDIDPDNPNPPPNSCSGVSSGEFNCSDCLFSAAAAIGEKKDFMERHRGSPGYGAFITPEVDAINVVGNARTVTSWGGRPIWKIESGKVTKLEPW